MNNGGLHVESIGQGAPIVLLHGWAMHSGLWGPLIPELASRYSVHAVDLPGHGYSAEIPHFTLDAIVDIVAESPVSQREALTVVGWSLGGLVALRWAQRDPTRVQRLILISTTPRFTSNQEWPYAMSEATLARFGDELHVAWKLTIERFLTLQIQGSEHGRSILSSLRKEVFARGQPSSRTLIEALDVLRSTDLRSEVACIHQRALVISGTRDTLALPGAARWLTDHLPNARGVAIEGAAHTPFLSHTDAVVDAVDRFRDDR